jgi:RHH-type proline utilization regulon transcriptional repressor/proline dehydrogenase/delta 1-pyrroline-5-carboxylate dehydrogenase
MMIIAVITHAKTALNTAPTKIARSQFEQFLEPGSYSSPLREAITAACRTPEIEAIPELLASAQLPAGVAAKAKILAVRIAEALRSRKASAGRAGLVQNLLQEYALSSQEGTALMCLAEALLRIPDSATRDALIRDKIAQGQWQTHLGKSSSLFVNATTWGLLITGKLVSTHSESGMSSAIARLVSLGGEPLIRKGVDMAMRMMGEQFVTSETIAQALAKACEREAEGFTYSFDMLGEAALTAHDAERYLREYETAIHAIGKASDGRGIYDGPGISIKLSALHPRYSRAQYDRVMAELYPVLVRLSRLAKRYDIGLNVDAEEADRLEISLDLLERLAFEPQLQGWNGLGFVIQAYQKRAPFVVDYVIDMARRSQRRLMIRLVKGAYWDSEIKRAQVDGQQDYPVYTRKPYTDLSYIACARKLLSAPTAIYPQFATHNAHTLAAIYELADPADYAPQQYEFQCLHGMGEPLYEQVVGPVAQGKLSRPCRIYAPVGTHETLLAYLVRRLLENGANTSFVNQIADQAISIEELVRDPADQIQQLRKREGRVGLPHPAIPLPANLYGLARKNSQGLDLADEHQLQQLAAAVRATLEVQWTACPLLAIETAAGETRPLRNPADRDDIVGQVRDASPSEVDVALAHATRESRQWAAVAPAERARILESAADRLEHDTRRLMGLLIREAGKTASNAVAEVREAVDFLRYYAGQVREHFNNQTHLPLGPVVCISPWNFPLAIFIGQVSAALAAGNTVLAKPAEQTPLVAAEAVRALWAAGVPRYAVQLLPGRGEVVGAQLVGDARIQGVLFTGSTDVARVLQRTVSDRVDKYGRAIPLIAETGGQNAMIVDSSALAEQVVADVLDSAFDSAGQRCSALRVLCVQEEAADRLLEMLLGAMAELRVGSPDRLAVDVGPVIDGEARSSIQKHVDALRASGRRIHQISGRNLRPLDRGTFVLPTLIELQSISELEREVFGPVLHFVRFKREELDGLIGQINGTGYGLTMGLHTRIDETIARVLDAAHAGNIYVNRNMVGAVVGVQPFGGEGLSGTGPKAGGPLYLYRLLSRRPEDVMSRVLEVSKADTKFREDVRHPLRALMQWARNEKYESPLPALCLRFSDASLSGFSQTLPGPTGERNVYSLVARRAVLCLAERDDDRLVQLAAVLAVGSRAIWPATAESLLQHLPVEVQPYVLLASDWSAPGVSFDAVLLHGDVRSLNAVRQKLAGRDGPIVSVERLEPGDTAIPLERLLVERTVSINTAAAGGNASLMTID